MIWLNATDLHIIIIFFIASTFQLPIEILGDVIGGHPCGQCGINILTLWWTQYIYDTNS